MSGPANPPPARPRPPGSARIVARTLTCAVFALAGVLFYVSFSTARGTDLRTDDSLLRLTDLIQLRSGQNQRAQDQLSALRAEADALAARRARDPGGASRLAALERSGGLEPLRGPGLTVTLDDAPPNATARIPGVPDPGPNDLVIHQQDVQAVVNALWRGGARGVQIMDQRLITTSAVRCVGNTLLLQGRVYSPPYVVRAVGDPDRLKAALDTDPSITNYLQYVAAYGLGWKIDRDRSLGLPGYSGPVELRYAHAG